MEESTEEEAEHWRCGRVYQMASNQGQSLPFVHDGDLIQTSCKDFPLYKFESNIVLKI